MTREERDLLSCVLSSFLRHEMKIIDECRARELEIEKRGGDFKANSSEWVLQTKSALVRSVQSIVEKIDAAGLGRVDFSHPPY